ncbi:MAG: preprotein translocase subunit SecY, partial [Actinomycetia bacterium]|nr:preprotein translocase subunit SecY [Actinomycetes bacterium]
IMPYITASIIMQLLTVVIPKLEEWAKEGEAGQRKITQITRYMTLIIAFTQSVALTFFVQTNLEVYLPFINKFLIIITMVAGTSIIMWLGELITQKGIGNGMSILIFISIISRFPQAAAQTYQIASPFFIVLVVLIIISVFASIILVEKGQRRIPVQYAKRIVGRKVYGGSSTYIPIKINSAGVMPIIFASSVLLVPGMIGQFAPALEFLSALMNPRSVYYLGTYFVLIIFFTYFYSEIVFNPVNLANDLKKWGGFIPGVRPGRPTALFINKVLTRITFPGAVFLGLVAVLPTIMLSVLNIPFFSFFGGTSILITVGVALETVIQLESQLVMRHYEGILK